MKTKYYSYNIGELPEGCKLCVQGRKLVLFVTGLCSRNCFYCPISDEKKNRDVVYANEWPIKNSDDMIKEAELTEAKGAGFTGGDPLVKLDRTLSYVKLLKKRFGKKFHIHLYTSLDLVDEKTLKKLYDAGLDEIRFHPDIYNKRLWPKIMLARKFSWDFGVEIPAIPNTEKHLLISLRVRLIFLTLMNWSFLMHLLISLQGSDLFVRISFPMGLRALTSLRKSC